MKLPAQSAIPFTGAIVPAALAGGIKRQRRPTVSAEQGVLVHEVLTQ
jgi:hypothetical protein